MPCNPSIGGTAKGTLVRELDALGGVMGLAADATYLQSRMLNKGKGPAVHALRVQTDRKRYHEYMKHALELTPGLAIHQAEVVGIEVENGHVKGVVTQLNGEYSAKCVVIATGTNLGGKIFVGDAWYASGPDGMHAANALTESLKAAVEQGKCPFAYSWQKDIRGYRAFKIPTVTFYLWYTNCHGVQGV